MSWFWGHTGTSFLDVWTIFHLAFWVFFGSCIWAFKWNRRAALIGCLVGAFAWEFFEKYAEKAWPNRWLNPESLWNSYISDPLTCLLGVCFAFYALDHWRKP
jgi:hypothetical protein